MYKAFSSGLLGFGGRSAAEDAPLAVKYGYEGIDFDIAKESQGDASAFRALLEDNNLKSGGFGLPVEYRTSQEVFEADMKKLPGYCDFAKKIDTDRCVTWILPSSDTLDYNANFKLHKDRLTMAAKVLEEYGIRFGLEFVGPPSARAAGKYEFIHNLEGILELISAIGTSNLGLLMDVWHWDMAQQTPDDFKKIPNKDWVVMVHINDAPAGISLDKQQDLSRELPGATGILKIKEFFKGLQSLAYDGPVYVEPFSEPLKALPVEEAVKQAKAAMDKVWL